MGLEKLTITPEKQEPIKVLFNPQELVISRTVWKINESGLPVATEALPSITLNLFLDTTLPAESNAEPRQKNVQFYTKKIFQLTEPLKDAPIKRPPLCQLSWGTIKGKDGDLISSGLLVSVTNTLTHFLEDGTPVRAKLNCTFQEWQEATAIQKAQNPIDDPVRVVRRGETLSSIAAEEYGNPALWRVIAQENRLTDPHVVPGQVLTVPPLRYPAQRR